MPSLQHFFIILVSCFLIQNITPTDAKASTDKIILVESIGIDLLGLNIPGTIIKDITVGEIGFVALLIQVNEKRADKLLAQLNLRPGSRAVFLNDILFPDGKKILETFENIDQANFVHTFTESQIIFFSHLINPFFAKETSKDDMFSFMVENHELFLKFTRNCFLKLDAIDSGLRSIKNHQQHIPLLNQIQSLGESLFIKKIFYELANNDLEFAELKFYFGMNAKMIDHDSTSERKIMYIDRAFINKNFQKEKLARAYSSLYEDTHERLNTHFIAYLTYTKEGRAKAIDFFKKILNYQFIALGENFTNSEPIRGYLAGVLNLFFEWYLLINDPNLKLLAREQIGPILTGLERNFPYLKKYHDQFDPHLLNILKTVKKTLASNELECLSLIKGIIEKSKSL